MKRIFKTAFATILAAAGFSSCSFDDSQLDPGLGMVKSYGAIEMAAQGIGEDYSIKLDDGSSLFIMSNLISGAEVEEGDRVLANYTILGDASDSRASAQYYVRLNGLARILCKLPVNRSFIESDPDRQQFRQDSIGRDPITIMNSWTGGRYLNIHFSMLRKAGAEEMHMVNLVYDDAGPDENGEAVVAFRHNAYRDIPSADNSMGFEYYEGVVSFDIMSIIPEDKNSVNLRLKWTEYRDGDWTGDFIEKETGLVFIPYVNSPASVSPTLEAGVYVYPRLM